MRFHRIRFIKKEYLIVIVGMIVNISFTFGQYSYVELLSLPWGKGDMQVGLRTAPSGIYGPTAFKIYNNKVYILDKENLALKLFSDNKLETIEEIPNKDIDKFNVSENGKILYSIYNGSIDTNKVETKLVKRGIGKVIENGKLIFNIFEENIGYLSCLGKIGDNYYYILREMIIQEIPLIVKRDVVLYDGDGSMVARFIFPVHSYSYIPEEFYIENGNLYKMISSTDGIHIIGWIRDGELPTESTTYELPDKFNGDYHYNNNMNILENPKTKKKTKNSREQLDYPPITPSEALTTAYQYIYFEWTATEENITGGLIQDPNGVYIETPSWVQVGTNYHIPYKWGGFNTLSEYTVGMEGCMYAGDKETSGVSSYTRGADCSGFVSRCWNLPMHYSTSMMDDGITIAYDSWSELKPGDAIHKVGHVRLMVYWNSDGSLLTAEASGYDWKVNYRVYTLSQLSSYTPRYYIYMDTQETPVIRTDFKHVTYDDSLKLEWEALGNDVSSGYKVYGSDGGGEWEELDNVSSQTNSWTGDIALLDSYIFFKLVNISQEDSVTESFPTDYYGAYNGNGEDKILIVDGFDRVAGTASYNLPYHPFAMTMAQAVKAWGVSFETTENSAILDGEIELGEYEAVFWLLGDESTADETFSDSEQELVKTYLRQGGKFFVSGSEIAWDLDYMGDSQDRDFINNYFKVGMAYDDANSYSINGVSGTPFSDVSLFYDDGTHGVYEEDYPDAFTLYENSTVMLKYGNNRYAGAGWTGYVPEGNEEAVFFIIGFPYETIYNQNDRVNFMGTILTYFDFDIEMTITNYNKPILPKTPILHSIYPNPFNSYTFISYQLPIKGKVWLDIYNLQGQLVATLVNNNEQEGFHNISWNGKDRFGKLVSSGSYFIVLKSGTTRDIKKIVLLK